MELQSVLADLMMIPAPSGYEQEMADKMRQYLSEYCDEVQVDLLGNVIGSFKGADAQLPTVMVFGHMDSLGLIIRKVEENGYLRAERLGGVPEKVLPGTEFLVRNEDGEWIPAIIGPKSHHVTPADEKYKVDTLDMLALDMGARTRAEIETMKIYTGCPAVYKPRVNWLCNGLVSGTAIDNRGACACLIDIARQLKAQRPECNVALVGTVQEEFNLRGAMMAARTVKPDIAIGLDVTLAGDTFDLKSRFDAALGGGPCVQLYTFHSRGTLNGNIAHEPLFRKIKETAEKAGMPLQRTTGLGMLTDASYIQLEGMGVAAIDMGFATRYTHTPVETCDTEDIKRLATLVSLLTRSIDDSFNLGRLKQS